MRTAETLLACCVVGLACFVVGQSVRAHPLPADAGAAGVIADARAAVPPSQAHGAGYLVATSWPGRSVRPSMPADDMRRRLAPGMSGTYLDAMLRTRDSALARWPDRTTRPVRVFIRDGDAIAGWRPDFLPVVRDAFETWVQAGIPVRFTFVVDSASADVHVHFTGAFADGISGKTVWSRDAAYWLVSSDIQLALSYPGGGFVTPPQLRAIALHEVGHLLGLDHANSADDIMSARVRVRELSEADRATVRLLYSVPAGSLR